MSNLHSEARAGDIAKQLAPEQTQSPRDHGQSLRDCVERAVSNYFAQIDDQSVTDVYDMVLQEVEAPLLGRSARLHGRSR